MKSTYSIKLKLYILPFVLSLIPLLGIAQHEKIETTINKGKTYLAVSWQMNYLTSHFVSDLSGWGGNAEAHYYLTENISLGLFMGWHTNKEYKEIQTYSSSKQSITTDMYRGVFQLPFGALIRYDFIPSKRVSPFATLKLGPSFSEESIYLYSVELRNRSWGFYVSPEIGVKTFLLNNRRFALQASAYYAYLTNGSNFEGVIAPGDFNNVGLKLGIAVQF